VTSRILRWSIKTLFVLVLLIVLAVASFRLTAAMRETGMRSEGLGHIPQIEDPDVFNDALLKALGKL
jgi:pimeloyl-ACP methyl ester carboxylesterase